MDRNTFEELISSHEKDLYSFCSYLSAAMAPDLYQDTVLAAFEARAKIDPSQNPRAFLFSIAAGKWKNMRRKAARRQKLRPDPHPEDLISKDDPEAQTQDTLARESIQSALATLDDKFRIPLILHYFDDLSLVSIAQICNVPQGTIKSRLHKGRALMMAALEKEGFYE